LKKKSSHDETKTIRRRKEIGIGSSINHSKLLLLIMMTR